MDPFFKAEILSKSLPLKKKKKVILGHKLNMFKAYTFSTKDCSAESCLSI